MTIMGDYPIKVLGYKFGKSIYLLPTLYKRIYMQYFITVRILVLYNRNRYGNQQVTVATCYNVYHNKWLTKEQIKRSFAYGFAGRSSEHAG